MISNYAPRGRLLTCVDPALAQDAAAGDFEVLVPLHGNITESEIEELQRRACANPRLRLLTGDYPDRARALNDAVTQADSEHLVFLESHVQAPPRLGAHHRRLLRAPGVAAVQGRFETTVGGTWTWEAETALKALNDERRQELGMRRDEFNLHNAGFNRGAIVAAGGFDERVPGIAEMPLLQRIEESRGRIEYPDSPQVEHVNNDGFWNYVVALRLRGYDVGLLWRLDPAVASVLFPAPKLERHAVFVRRFSLPLLVTAEIRLVGAFLWVQTICLLRLRRLLVPAAGRLVWAAIRVGLIKGFCSRDGVPGARS